LQQLAQRSRWINPFPQQQPTLPVAAGSLPGEACACGAALLRRRRKSAVACTLLTLTQSEISQCRSGGKTSPLKKKRKENATAIAQGGGLRISLYFNQLINGMRGTTAA
jgi:hypothetical protein